jgi:hypothetical protein
LFAVLLQCAFSYALIWEGLAPYPFHKNFFLLIYPLIIYSVVAADMLIKRIYDSELGKTKTLLALFAFLFMAVLLMHVKSAGTYARSCPYFGPADTFTIIYRGNESPMYLAGDALAYNRTGNIPALYDAARWMKAHRNCSNEPCPEKFFYTGPSDAFWLYGMSRSPLIVEAYQNGSIIQGLERRIPPEDLLYQKNGICIYKKEAVAGSKKLPYYPRSWETIKDEAY